MNAFFKETIKKTKAFLIMSACVAICFASISVTAFAAENETDSSKIESSNITGQVIKLSADADAFDR